jgi:Flp pilus assembly protein TadB
MRPPFVAGAALALAGVLIVVGSWRTSRARLGGVVRRDEEARPAQRARSRRLVMAVATGGAVALLVGGAAGVVAGLGVGAAMTWLMGRRVPEATRRERRRIESDLPYAAELLAAALRAGARPDSAVDAVGTAIGGPLGERFLRVGGALRLGAPAAEAWTCLGDSSAALALRRAAVRSEHSGAAFAETLRRQAEDLRADRVAAADAAGRRAAVLIVLPLGLCFLPAFVLAGLVPVIVAVLGDVLPP